MLITVLLWSTTAVSHRRKATFLFFVAGLLGRLLFFILQQMPE